MKGVGREGVMSVEEGTRAGAWNHLWLCDCDAQLSVGQSLPPYGDAALSLPRFRRSLIVPFLRRRRRRRAQQSVAKYPLLSFSASPPLRRSDSLPDNKSDPCITRLPYYIQRYGAGSDSLGFSSS